MSLRLPTGPPSASHGLSTLEAALRVWAQQLSDHRELISDSWYAHLGRSVSGAAFDEAFTAHLRLTSPAEQVISVLRQAEGVSSAIATARRDLEQRVAEAIDHLAAVGIYLRSGNMLYAADHAVELLPDARALFDAFGQIAWAIDQHGADELRRIAQFTNPSLMPVLTATADGLDQLDAPWPPHPHDVKLWVSQHPEVELLDSPGEGFAYAVGDPGASSHIIIVGGVGSSSDSSWERNLQRALTTAAATDSRVVMWTGYDAPGVLPFGISDRRAHDAAGDVHSFVEHYADQLRDNDSSSGSDRTLTLVGYSYGSLVAGLAARQGLPVDSVVFVGSPGTGAHDVEDLRIKPGGKVYAVMGTSDPIRVATSNHQGLFGPDPGGDSFGAIGVEVPADHSGYWESSDFLDVLRRASAP